MWPDCAAVATVSQPEKAETAVCYLSVMMAAVRVGPKPAKVVLPGPIAQLPISLHLAEIVAVQ